MADPKAQAFPLITTEALAELRKRIGVPARRPAPYIEVATRDAVRHWAAGIGDRNPFWLESGVAPPTILFALDRIVYGYVGGLPGIHAMYGGTDFRWRRDVREDDRLTGASVLLDLEEKPSAFAKRAIKQTYRTTFTDAAGGIVCEADSWCFRTERDTARERQVRARRAAPLQRRGDRAHPGLLPRRAGPRRGATLLRGREGRRDAARDR